MVQLEIVSDFDAVDKRETGTGKVYHLFDFTQLTKRPGQHFLGCFDTRSLLSLSFLYITQMVS